MRNGYKIYDSDTHINPSAEDLLKYIDPDFRSRIPDLDAFKSANGPPVDGEPQRHVYQHGQLRYRRVLGEATNDPVLARQRINASGALRGGGGNQKAAVQLRVGPNGIKDGDPKDRVMDMDYEGCDVQFMFAGGWPGVGAKDPTLQAGLMRAFHRWMNDYCADYPDRLKAGIVVSADNIEVSVEEIKTWGNTKWAAAILPWVGRDKPLDHPDLEPIWAAAADHDLAVASHGNTWQYPYFPGYEDVWENVLLARSASHPWTAQRFIGSFIGSGIMDRYPNIQDGRHRGRFELAAVLERPPHRAGRVRGRRPALAACLRRLHGQRTFLQQHRAVGRTYADQVHLRLPGRRRADVRL